MNAFPGYSGLDGCTRLFNIQFVLIFRLNYTGPCVDHIKRKGGTHYVEKNYA